MMAIFMQEPMYTRKRVACMSSKIFDPEIDGERMATMKARQRKIANEGIEKINKEDDATYACLKATSNPHRNRSVLERFGKTLCILPTTFGPAAGIIQHKVHAPAHLASTDKLIDDSQLVISHIGDLATSAAATPYMQKLEEAALEGKTVLHFVDQFPGAERNNYTGSMPWTDGRGNISFMCNDPVITKMVKEWADGEKYMAPMCVSDIGRKEFIHLIIDKLQPTTVEHSQQRLRKKLCTKNKHTKPLTLSKTMKTSEMNVMKSCSMSKRYWKKCHYPAQKMPRRNDDRSG
jgi:hypothetical protein